MNVIKLNRAGEEGSIPNRCDRFYNFENEWFFTTREGSPVGPFSTQESAKSGLVDYLDFLTLASPKVKKVFIRAMTKDTA